MASTGVVCWRLSYQKRIRLSIIKDTFLCLNTACFHSNTHKNKICAHLRSQCTADRSPNRTISKVRRARRGKPKYSDQTPRRLTKDSSYKGWALLCAFFYRPTGAGTAIGERRRGRGKGQENQGDRERRQQNITGM